MRTLNEERCEAMALLQAGKKPSEVAEQLQRSESWVRKWQQRFRANGYAGLQEQSRRPKKPRQLRAEVREAIIKARRHLEAQASQGIGLKYIGGRAVRSYLRQQNCDPLPSVPSIERVLRWAGLTKQKERRLEPEISYPHLRPPAPHESILCRTTYKGVNECPVSTPLIPFPAIRLAKLKANVAHRMRLSS